MTVQISADLKNAGFPELEVQPLQTAIINILPNKDYRLPEAIIKINNQIASGLTESTNVATDSGVASGFVPSNTFKIDLNNKLTFDAMGSKPGTTKIKKYRWDFGQEKESTKKVDTFSYKLPQFYISAVLRVEDENGYFSDTFVNIENSGLNEENNPEAEDGLKFLGVMAGAMLITAIIGAVSFWIFNKLKSRSKRL